MFASPHVQSAQPAGGSLRFTEREREREREERERERERERGSRERRRGSVIRDPLTEAEAVSSSYTL